MVTSLIKLVTECHSSIKFQNPRWLPILPYDSATKLLFLNYQLTTFSTAFTSQNKQFVTPVWVFGWWQLIMSTMKCYGYKIPPGLLTCAPRRSIVLQFFWHVDTRPISPFLFFFNSTFYLCIIIVIFTWCIWYINWSCWQSYITLSVLMF